MHNSVINITELSNPCITRNRGKEAATKLAKYLDRFIEIDLNRAELVSLSFLDELICHYIKLVNNGNISFSTNDKNTELKLAKIASVRSVTIHCSNSQQKGYIVSPVREEMPTPVLANSKGL